MKRRMPASIRPMMPKSTAHSTSAGIHEQIARMHVGVEKSVAQRLRQKTAHDHDRDSFGIMSCGQEGFGVAQAGTIHPFGGEYFRSGARPIQNRDTEIVVVAGVVREFRSRRRFHPEIEFELRRTSASVSTTAMSRSRRASGRKPLRDFSGQAKCRKITLKFRFNARTQNLYRDAARRIVRSYRLVHLGN